ncbi:5-(carboxyamino)imidazole ribonucleotide synthase [Bifidobacterium choloepi]|uniref:N5-carboxyaminoimidazole ribonucleotide synthase n=1 Tax=Bifidobacterium choloepi TaxID=2614131 RepID=A0A6I5MYT4_9BIFI|nr:5-(carboxyamino)imidazole ribonucleotide synthase [Bifidobacterium choloepi]NEG69437.1 5-(carboxyamino)imidazole ribonucleotide synthase [Bifidobacterium choloepi]
MPSLSDETNATLETLLPGGTIGIVGGGQLGRMMALSARYAGYRVGVLDPTDNCPAAQVADFQVVADYGDEAAIADLAARSDVLTYEFENVDAAALDAVRGAGVAGGEPGTVAIPQGTDLLRVTQNRIREKTFVNDHGIATAPWRAVNSRADVDAALAEIGYPAVLKTAEGGYDGHGQVVLRSADDLAKVWPDESFPPSILEGFVDFAFEASVLVAGNGRDYVTFPIVENIHRHNILHLTLAPANVDNNVHDAARQLALTLAEGFRLAGTLAIELFVMPDGTLIVNELAPRPHNSGHYTIEACDFDQFDLHVRGICGLPLAEPKLLSPAVMVNVLGQHVDGVRAALAGHPDWHAHDYGKAVAKHDRKMGHVTVLTDDPEATAAGLEATGIWSDLS